MRFFTPKWMNGDFSDKDSEQVPFDYRHYLDSLHLESQVRQLAYDVNLHDGRMLDLCSNDIDRTILIRFRCGDNQHGYRDQIIMYREVRVDCLSLEILQSAKGPPFDELLYDEVDRRHAGYLHRILFASNREANVQFSDVELNAKSVDRRDSP